MKILHTADIHLGRQFNRISLDDDHAEILGQIFNAIVEREVDVLVIAGDIYDRASPPATAVRQFNQFLRRVATETEVGVVMIAGNHDSGDRIDIMSVMTDSKRALIRGAVSDDEPSLILSDEHGEVAFSCLPFSYEYAARECFRDEEIETPEEVLKAQIASARKNVPADARWVVVAHGFISGAATSEGERSLTRVGGVETVSLDVFSGAHYVALGHLHRPQFVDQKHIRYSGSPLAFGFDEALNQKSMSLVTMDGLGNVEIEELPFKPLHGVRVLRGKHAELLLTEPSDDFIKIVLTDEVRVIDAMKRMQQVFPNACELVYEKDMSAPETKSLSTSSAQSVSPVEMVSNFLRLVRENPMSDRENEVVATGLEELRKAEDLA